MSSQISVIMSATQGPAGPAGPAGSAGPAGAQGEAGPAGPAGAFTDAGITSGTSMAYTAVLADRPEPLTAGYSFLIVPHVTNGVSPTISLSGGTAQPIWVKGASIPAGAMVANNPYALRSDGTRCHVEGQLNLSADEIAVLLGYSDSADMVAAIEAGGNLTPSTKTTTYTTTTADNFIRGNHASTPFTITLHAATGSGQKITIVNINAAVVTVDGNSAETIGGALTVVLQLGDSITIVDAASGVWDLLHCPISWQSAFLTKTTDQGSISTSAALVTWDASRLGHGITLSSNEITLAYAGEYEISFGLPFASTDVNAVANGKIEDWTSGSAVQVDWGRLLQSASTQRQLHKHGVYAFEAGTKLRLYAYVGTGTAIIDADGGSGTGLKACYFYIRRVK